MISHGKVVSASAAFGLVSLSRAELCHASDVHVALGPFRSACESFEALPASTVVMLACFVVAALGAVDLIDRVWRGSR